MKRLLSITLMICIALCIAVSANALTINVPEEVPANSDFGFSITLPATDAFTYTEIYFDNSLILTAFANGTVTANGKFVLNAFTFDENPSSNEGLTLYVSYFSIPPGQHEIRAISYNNSIQSSQENKSFNSVKISAQELEDRIQNISTQLNASIESVKSETISTAEAKVNELKASVDELKNNLSGYETKEELQAKLDEISGELTKLKSQISETKKQALLEEQQKPSFSLNPSGFVNFGIANRAWIILFIGIVFVAIALISTKRKGGTLLSFSKGYTFENKRMKKSWPPKLSAGEAMGEAMEDKNKIPTEESVHFGDILRK